MKVHVKEKSCISDARNWIFLNFLKMNASKTDFLPIVPPRYKSLIDGVFITIDGDTIISVEQARNLGSYFDR